MDYSIVVPVYNSTQSLRELCRLLHEFFSKLKNSFEIIFVNDASIDSSWSVIDSMTKKYPGIVKGIDLASNSGQHNATFCGLGFASGQYVITIDDDLQVLPDQITLLLEEVLNGNCDLVYGIYHDKKHSKYRNLSSKAVRFVSDKFFDRHAEVTSFRLIKRDLVDKVLEGRKYFIFLDELLAWYTQEIGFVEVKHQRRPYQKSSYSFGALVEFFTNLLVVYTNIPLKLMVYLGLLMSIVCFVIGFYYVILKIFVSRVPAGYTSIIVGVLFSTGLILFALGIIGEYLSRLYLSINNKPPFIVRKVSK
ncbi:MAG: glycosyltransferase family 2 protein [Bacteroidales bacterium]